MKFPGFAYTRPAALPAALAALAADDEAVAVAGGQSLMPMLSFRVVRPSRLVDIARLSELQRIETTAGALRIGAGVTHAQLEDGVAPGVLGVFLARAASGIAFRAIRNRGTVGGSLAHADPAADWPVVFAALGASVETAGSDGLRSLSVSELIEDQMQTTLRPGELITSISVPAAGWSRFGLHKSARKAGEFAEALAVATVGADGLGIWVGVLAGRPLRLAADVDPAELQPDRRISGTASCAALLSAIEAAAPGAAPYRAHLAAVAACRAVSQAYSEEGASDD
jgi:aerobic carbon-monoxide dehydrogenase medium subunit